MSRSGSFAQSAQEAGQPAAWRQGQAPMIRGQGAPETAGHTGSDHHASGAHASAEGGGAPGAGLSCAHAHTRRSPGPPEARASSVRSPPRPSAAGVPLSQVPRGRPRPTSAGAWDTTAETRRPRAYLRRRTLALRFTKR